MISSCCLFFLFRWWWCLSLVNFNFEEKDGTRGGSRPINESMANFLSDIFFRVFKFEDTSRYYHFWIKKAIEKFVGSFVVFKKKWVVWNTINVKWPLFLSWHSLLRVISFTTNPSLDCHYSSNIDCGSVPLILQQEENSKIRNFPPQMATFLSLSFCCFYSRRMTCRTAGMN